MDVVDPLTRFLDGPRATRAFALSLEMTSPWGIDVCDGAALTIVVVSRGRVLLDGQRMDAGDLALIRGPEPYLVTDSEGSPSTIRIDEGQRCTTLDGRDLRDDFRQGIRRWGNADRGDGDASLLVATYERTDEAGGMVSRVLPRVAIVPSTQTDDALVEALTREISNGDPAAQIMIDRLIDMLVISAIRSWLARPDRPPETAWITCSDPLIVRALDHLHADPSAAWTIETLARRLHVSRASLAAKFRNGVGEPPMTYLTRWRMVLAGDLLLAPGSTVADTARSVGYDNAFAFSTAFRRHTGLTPTQYRRRQPMLSPT